MNQSRLIVILLLLFVSACGKQVVTFSYNHVQPIGFDVQPPSDRERDKLFSGIRAWLLKQGFTEATSEAERTRVTVSTSTQGHEFVYSRILDPSQPQSFASIACQRMPDDPPEYPEYRIILRGFRYGGPLDHRRQEALVEKYFADFQAAFPELKKNR